MNASQIFLQPPNLKNDSFFLGGGGVGMAPAHH